MELNATTEWQDAINFSDRHNARYRHECRLKELKRKKLIHRAVDLALVGAMAISMNILFGLNLYVAIGMATICLGACCFILGQVFERSGDRK